MKENFRALVWTSAKCYCGNKTDNPEWAVSTLPTHGLIQLYLRIEGEDLIFTCFLSCSSHLTSFIFSVLTGKTKSIVKNDKLVKKKLPDYKVAYVVLVGFLFFL